jgi:UDP-N-acetyl-D-mannosaminuronic acid dehydrogenase
VTDGPWGALARDVVIIGDADPGLRLLGEVVAQSDLLIIGAPHPGYADLVTDKPAPDIWNVLGKGVLV